MLEYQPYTQRHALTTPFAPSEAEQTLYEHISAYLQRDFSYDFPQQQKHLVALVLRKLLASSTVAVVATLQATGRGCKSCWTPKASTKTGWNIC